MCVCVCVCVRCGYVVVVVGMWVCGYVGVWVWVCAWVRLRIYMCLRARMCTCVLWICSVCLELYIKHAFCFCCCFEMQKCPFGALYNTRHKPTYASLIALAIKSSPRQQLLLSDIYTFVEPHRCLLSPGPQPNWRVSGSSFHRIMCLRASFQLPLS